MKKFTKVIQIVLSVALAAGIFVIGCGFAPARLPRSCFIDGVNVSGMRLTEAQALLRGQMESALDGYSLTVRVGGRSYTFAPPTVYVKSDLSAVLARARKKSGAYTLQKEVCLKGEEETLRGICDDFYKKAVPRILFFSRPKRSLFYTKRK